MEKIPSRLQSEKNRISPEYVRISMAAAIELGLKPGRISRCGCTCINLLQNYPQGCYANCTYCGLARERSGVAEDNSFIRVSWPLFPTNLVAERIGIKERQNGVGRVCVSQVQDHRANADLIEMIQAVRVQAPEVPVSALVTATLLDVDWLRHIRNAGADIVGIGLDAASEEVFYRTRGRGAHGPHKWEYHWEIIRKAREIFGLMKVNCHLIVGLGETDLDLVRMFYLLKSEEIAGYLFSFNPEPGTAMETAARTPIERTRRIQLVKFLIEKNGLPESALNFDDAGRIRGIDAPEEMLETAIKSGIPFMTNGCPDRESTMACNRPYGSYRPGEEFRDYPFLPQPGDIQVIREQMDLRKVLASSAETHA